MLGPNDQFVVATTKDVDWADRLVPVEGNHATISSTGALEFWNIVDRVWHPVIVFAAGQWESYRVAKRTVVRQEETEVFSPDEPPQDLDDLTPEPEKSITELRQEVLAGLGRGEYPEVGGVTGPKKLKDIWEGRGDPSDAGPEADAGSWPQDGTREEIDAWVAEQARKDQEIAAQLRVEADAERDQSIALPAHLRDEETPPPYPDYTRYGLPKTQVYGSDGVPITSR